jgi:hypothetical protein
MELAVQVDGTLKFARGGDPFEVRCHAFKVSQRRRGKPPGQLLTRRQLGGQRLERGPHGVRVLHGGRGHRGYPDAPARAVHQAVAFQAPQRLAHWRSAHRQLGAQRHLRKPVACPVHAGHELLPQALVHRLAVHHQPRPCTQRMQCMQCMQTVSRRRRRDDVVCDAPGTARREVYRFLVRQGRASRARLWRERGIPNAAGRSIFPIGR